MSIIQAIEQTENNAKSISASVTQIRFNEHTLLKIDHPKCQAAISLQGAHLLYWQPVNTPTPVIWLSNKTLFKKGTAIRGGIPICWPWFANVSSPSHGFARIVDWQMSQVTETAEGVEIVFTLRNNQDTQQYWPHAFELTMTFKLGTNCEAHLSCSGDFEATSALHTYFGVDDISSVTISGLGDNYHEKLSTVNPPKVIGQMTFDQEVDRIYSAAMPETLITDSHRTIKVSHINNSDVVVWNPWVERAQAMNDLDDDSYQHFVCVETCRVTKPIQSTSTEKTHFALKVEVTASS